MSQDNMKTLAVEKKYSDKKLENTLDNIIKFNPLSFPLKFLPEEVQKILLSGHLDGLETLKNGVNEATRNVKQRSKLIEYGIPDGLWPMDKEITDEKGIDELEELGYKLFYKGKNADLYLIPGRNPIELLVYRTDRTSVFDIPLDLEVEGKGEIQNQIGLLGVEFAKSKGFDVANRELPKNIPENLKARCQAVELCKPLTIEIDGQEKGLELILRNNLIGSLYRAYKEGEDPYGLELSEGLKEWDYFYKPIFTPTTKEKNDTPIKSSLVQEAYPEIVEKLTQMFTYFTIFSRKKGYIIIDSKFEIFINSQGKPVLGDEILTTESSRFIKIEDYENGIFKSADKEIARQLGIKFKWREKFKALKEENPEAKILSVKDDITPNHKAEILSAYTGVFNALSDNKKYVNTSKGPFAVSIGKHSDGYIEVFLDKDNNVRILEKTEEEALKSLIEIINNPPRNYLEKSPFLRELHGVKNVTQTSNDKYSSDTPLKTPKTDEEFLREGYKKEYFSIKEEEDKRYDIDIWIKKSNENGEDFVEISVCGCPSLFSYGITEKEALDCLRDKIFDYQKDTKSEYAGSAKKAYDFVKALPYKRFVEESKENGFKMNLDILISKIKGQNAFRASISGHENELSGVGQTEEKAIESLTLVMQKKYNQIKGPVEAYDKLSIFLSRLYGYKKNRQI